MPASPSGEWERVSLGDHSLPTLSDTLPILPILPNWPMSIPANIFGVPKEPVGGAAKRGPGCGHASRRRGVPTVRCVARRSPCLPSSGVAASQALPPQTAACCCSPCTLIHHWEAQPTQNWWGRVGQRDAWLPGRERATKLTRLCPGPTLLYELAPESRKHQPAPTGVHLVRWAAPKRCT